MVDAPEPIIPNYDPRPVAKAGIGRSRPSKAAIRMTGVKRDACPVCQEIDPSLLSEEEAALVCEKHKAELDSQPEKYLDPPKQ